MRGALLGSLALAATSMSCGISSPVSRVPTSATAANVAGPPPGGCGYAPSAFSFPNDELACDGPQFVRYDDRYGLFVGLTTCSSIDEVRIYLSDDGRTYYPATDSAGNGQDECELVNPGFTITDEDDITSGGCTACSTSYNLPLEGVPVWTRANFGEAFTFVPSSPTWSDQTSRLKCGYDVEACAPVPASVPADPHTPPLAPTPAPQGDVACAPGGQAPMSFVISAGNMREGDGDTSGPGTCTGVVTFVDDLQSLTTQFMSTDDGLGVAQVSFNGDTVGCDTYHCGTLVHADGRAEEQMCDVWAYCDPSTGRAQAVGFTW